MTNVFISDTERRYTGLRRNCETWVSFPGPMQSSPTCVDFFLFDNSHSTHPWRKKWQSPVFLPGKFHGKRSLVGYTKGLQRIGHERVTKHSIAF